MARSLLRQSRYITSAAMEEAAELGHPEVDVDHLLLGLLATGGPSSQVLLRHGIDLRSARAALQEVQRADLGELADGTPAPRQISTFRQAQALPFSGRALEVMNRPSWRADDTALLRELLADGGRATRLVEHLGLDPQALRTDAATLAPEFTTNVLATVSVDVAASAEQVWAVVTDEHRRPEWEECAGVEVDEDGVTHVTFTQRGKTYVADHRVVRRIEGREIVRHRFRIAGRTIDNTHTVRLEPTGAGCRLTLELDADSRFTRALRPVRKLMARSQLRFQAQAIARAASR